MPEIVGPLGRREPTDWTHVEAFPVRRGIDVPTTVAVAERTLSLPRYRAFYDQGSLGACVGFSASWMQSIYDRQKYDARRLYHEAQKIDEWDDTPPEEGTSVRAGLEVLRTRGHWPILYRGIPSETPHLTRGILEYRWATTVDEIRASIASGNPVVLGINWYSSFFSPEVITKWGIWREYWIGRGHFGFVRGGHAICAYRVSDKRQAVGLVNTWGTRYPLVWLGYSALQRLMNEQGEAGLVSDRI